MLVGQDSLPAMIERTHVFSLHHEMCVVLTLEPIEKNETQAMVASLGHCDFEHVETLFDDKKLHYFWQLSKGNPSELDYHISRWLQENNPIQQVELTNQPQGTLGKSIFYGLLVILLSSVLVYQEEINHWINQESKKPANKIEKTNKQADDKVKQTLEDNQAELEPAITQQAKPEPQAKNNQAEHNNNLSKNASVPSMNSVQENQSKANIDKSINVVDSETSVSSRSNELATPVSLNQGDKAPLPIVKKIPNKIQLNEAENWLLTQPAEAFSLQWVGLSQQQSAKDFVAQHPLSNKLKIYRRITKGKTLYLVVSGSFASRESATEAVKSYQKQGIKASPWVKPIAAIQSEIKAFQSAQR